MPTIFEKIIAREIPSYTIYEDEAHYAFLTIEPIQLGHTLVIPKKPIAHLFDMEKDEYKELMKVVRKVALLIQSKTKCEKVGVIVDGFGVKDHAHVHLVPLTGSGQLSFAHAQKAPPDELARMQALLTSS